ncbi:hypothetical protein BJX68DRAFT_250350 [Aspergillus pseudodeflectus]|uniref:Uncharacterized protein n=1 Tax=Aspergillus pseudodeflectus TaxID=176178 RepID=A0ABR4JAG4_9EURO
MHLPPAGIWFLASTLGLAIALPMEDALAPSMGIEKPIEMNENVMENEMEHKMHIHHVQYMHDEIPKRAMQTGPAFNIDMSHGIEMDDKHKMGEQMHMYHEHDYYAQKEKRHDDPIEDTTDEPTLTKPPTSTTTSETTTDTETTTTTTTSDDEPTKPPGHYDEYGKYGDYGKYGHYGDYDGAIGRETDIPRQSWRE